MYRKARCGPDNPGGEVDKVSKKLNEQGKNRDRSDKSDMSSLSTARSNVQVTKWFGLPEEQDRQSTPSEG